MSSANLNIKSFSNFFLCNQWHKSGGARGTSAAGRSILGAPNWCRNVT